MTVNTDHLRFIIMPVTHKTGVFHGIGVFNAGIAAEKSQPGRSNHIQYASNRSAFSLPTEPGIEALLRISEQSIIISPNAYWLAGASEDFFIPIAVGKWLSAKI